MMDVLVIVAIVEGSGPREPGARMRVGRDTLQDTIGGGHLEMRAIEIARAMLADGRQRHIERFALGPSLGQCCGGVVHLAFEQVSPAQIVQPARHDTWRMVALDGEPDAALYDADGRQLQGQPAPLFARDRGTHVVQEHGHAGAAGRRWLVDLVAAPRAHLVLFGAGHVGAAIVRALAHLPCTVTWVDEREDMFPPEVPANVTIEATDTPESIVAAAPAGASYLVMTHSHALDQRLTQAIMQRDGVLWFGLIGSRTKRRQFEHRLRERGVSAARIDAMVCPIGLPGISGKQPAVIAAAVSAQLLMVWEQAASAATVIPTLKLVAHARGRT